jgi:cytochrome c oxidase assembly factor CtaG
MSLWPVEPSVSLSIVATAALYLRGWSVLRLRLPDRFDARRALVFVGGLSIIVFALSAPFEALTQQSLSAHMVQHLVLTVVAAPMLWLGAPTAPLFVALPRPVRRTLLAVTRSRFAGWLLHPGVGWVAFAVSFWVWHVPALYDLALESDAWHHLEHACFFVSALLFWRPVVLAWPARISWPRWTMIPYLALAMLQSLPLAAILTFSDRVLYAGYASIDDQARAGVIMWVPGSFPLLLPILRLIVELSSGRVIVEERHA